MTIAAHTVQAPIEKTNHEASPNLHVPGSGDLANGLQGHPRTDSRWTREDDQAWAPNLGRNENFGHSKERIDARNDVGRGELEDKAPRSTQGGGAGHWPQGEWLRAVLAARRRREIGTLAVSISVALAGFADNHTGESWSSIKRIAGEIGAKTNWRGDCSPVTKGLAQLKRAGLLRIVRRGHMRSSLYVPTIPPDKPSLVTSRSVTRDGVTRHGVTTSANVATHLPQGVGYTLPKVAELHHGELHSRTSSQETRAQERARFDRFWDVWPNQNYQPEAVEKFAKKFATLCHDKHKLDEIIAGVHRYIEYNPSDRLWISPMKFLSEERWTDEPAPTGKLHREISNSPCRVILCGKA
jgi:hypothetical protein